MDERLDDEAWLKAQYDTRTLQSIADELGVNRNTVRNRMIKFGIERRTHGEHFRGTPKPPEQRQKMAEARRRYWERNDSPERRDTHKLKVSAGRRDTGIKAGRMWVYVLGRGKIFRSRYVAEQMIGRRLTRDEIVHHIDRNKLNDHPSNLMVLTQEQHSTLHMIEDRERDATNGRIVA